jgi:hypothetical protein
MRHSIIAYHGTAVAFDRFSQKGGLGGAAGHWFASCPEAAAVFASPRMAGDSPRLIAAQLNLVNPVAFDGHRMFQEAVSGCNGKSYEDKVKSLRRKLLRSGHDGILIKGSDTDCAGVRDDYVVFDPRNIEIVWSAGFSLPTGVSKLAPGNGSPYLSDASGKPRTFYHGTNAEFEDFDTSPVYEIDRKRLGAYFTENQRFASCYGAKIIEAHLAIKNPFDITGTTADEVIARLPISDFLRRELRSAFRGADNEQYAMIESAQREGVRGRLEMLGFDGIRYTEGHGDAYVVFHPQQILRLDGKNVALTRDADASTSRWRKLGQLLANGTCTAKELARAIDQGLDVEAPICGDRSCIEITLETQRAELLQTILSGEKDNSRLLRLASLAQGTGSEALDGIGASYKARVLIASEATNDLRLKPR